jgi:hypothetical protein
VLHTPKNNLSIQQNIPQSENNCKEGGFIKMGMFKKKEFKKTEPPEIDEVEVEDIEEEIEDYEDLEEPEAKPKKKGRPKKQAVREEEEIEDELDVLEKKLQSLKVERQKDKSKTETLVVRELPTTPVRQYHEKDGTVVNLITIEEALTMLLEDKR